MYKRACELIKTTHLGNKIIDQISSLSVKGGVRKQQTSEFYKPVVLCTICICNESQSIYGCFISLSFIPIKHFRCPFQVVYCLMKYIDLYNLKS